MKFLLFFLLFLTGCVCLDPAHKRPVPPQVSTERVIESLKQVREELNTAGQENDNVSVKIDKALTLAEKLDNLLAQIEAMYSQGKSTIKPE